LRQNPVGTAAHNVFTGIIKGKGQIVGVVSRGADLRLEIRSEELPWSDYDAGDSIAVSGVCLTATTLSRYGFEADVSAETLTVTTLGNCAQGAYVNLEPALAVGDRLGGHLVSGHIDCQGKVKSVRSDGRSTILKIEIPRDYARYVAKKGSICIDGVSLTINEVSGTIFELNIIPHTAQVTTLGSLQAGDAVNIEIDQLARYLERLLTGEKESLSEDFLRKHGYAR
jgi:riboflavin synthase